MTATLVQISEIKKKLCYELNEDIILEILFNKQTPLRFIILIYILYFKNINFKDKEIFPLIQQRKDILLDELLTISERGNLSEYFDNHFSDIDEEVLFGYSMSVVDKLSYIRQSICKQTNNLEILNELSKYRDDIYLLRQIMFKTQSGKKFKDSVENNTSIYSIETLHRISQYEEYYKYEDKFSLISFLAKNYNISLETREYLFKKYNDDIVILESLNNHSLTIFKYSDIQEKLQKRITELLEEVEEIIEIENFSSIGMGNNISFKL